MKIAVLGAGINGLACAVKIKEKYRHAHVVLISEQFSPNTTGDGSGGLWYPYLCGDTPEHLLVKWGIETYYFLHRLWLEGGRELSFMPVYNMYRDKDNLKQPLWAKHVFGYNVLNDREIKYFNRLFSFDYGAGQTFSTFVIYPPSFLGYLYQRFTKSGGEVHRAKVTSLRDPVLQEYDVVVNCTGLNAKYLVPDDAMFPYRGQITKVRAPWVNITVMDEDNCNYIIPNSRLCVLGGTHQEHDYSTRLYQDDAAFIMDHCRRIMPSLQNADVLSQWVGLRPGRSAVRLEAEMVDGKLFIHNYGHGGCGLTLFWGCATDVLQLLDQNQQKLTKCKL